MTSNPDKTKDRDSMLAAIRKHSVPPAELPKLDDSDWLTFENPPDKFAESITSIGGQVFHCSEDSLPETIEDLETWRDASQVFSTIAGVSKANVALTADSGSDEIESIDFAIVRGKIGVAENGAIWLTDENLPHRGVLFAAQHLAIVIRASQIVNNMHEAYDRIEFGSREFGIFIAGPSKTADIEQSLVIGAHGARSLCVIMTN